MKRFIPLVLLIILPLFSLAQVANKTQVGCMGETANTWMSLANGKALLIASEGFDCPICQSTATSLGTFATNHTAEVTVWGAMTYLYTSGTPTCDQLSTWVQNHGWQQMFNFIDADQFWFNQATPRYIVVDPADSSIAYDGASMQDATNTALSISTATGLEPVDNSANFKTYVQDGQLVVSPGKNPGNESYVSVFDITGKQLAHHKLQNTSNQQFIHLPAGMRSGLYLLRFNTSFGTIARKIYIP